MPEVTVLEARRTAPNSRARSRNGPISVERIRVAAYVNVNKYSHPFPKRQNE